MKKAAVVREGSHLAVQDPDIGIGDAEDGDMLVDGVEGDVVVLEDVVGVDVPVVEVEEVSLILALENCHRPTGDDGHNLGGLFIADAGIFSLLSRSVDQRNPENQVENCVNDGQDKFTDSDDSKPKNGVACSSQVVVDVS